MWTRPVSPVSRRMNAPYGAMRTTVPGTMAPISALMLATNAPLQLGGREVRTEATRSIVGTAQHARQQAYLLGCPALRTAGAGAAQRAQLVNQCQARRYHGGRVACPAATCAAGLAAVGA